jgi:NMD protein affecting ribosome stability and mRNA decay
MSAKQNTERYNERTKLRDPYLLSKAYPEPTICPTCGLVFHKKRWSRDEQILSIVSKVAEKHKCPACRKIEDHYVMGFVTITGTFVPTVKSEIINIIHNQEKKEQFRNPLARIMSLNNKDETIVVETTNDNLAIAIGKALNRSHGGELNVNYASNEQFARVNWHRDLEVGSKPTHK